MSGKFWIGGLILALSAGTVPARPAAAATPYEIHVIASLSGGGSFLGKEEEEALKLAEPVFNAEGGIHGHPIHFTFRDDQSTPQVAVQAANDAIADHPAVILGSSLVAACNAMTPLMKNGPVMYCFSPGIHPPKGSFVFTSSVSTGDYADALIRFFRLKGRTRMALLTSTDATGQDAEHGFDKLLALPANKDIKVVERAHFNTNDVSVSAQIERVKAANPQFFIGWSTGSPIATIFRGIVQAGLNVPFGTTGGNMTYAEMHQFAAFLPKVLYLPSSEWPADGDPRLKLDPGVAAKQKAFFAAFAKVGKKPDEGAVLAWDPASIIVDALRALPDGATAAQLNAYLQKLKGQPGIDGVYDYLKVPQRGLSVANTIITRWNAKSDRWEVVAGPTGIPLAH